MVLPVNCDLTESLASYLADTQRLHADVTWCGIAPPYCAEIVQAAVELGARPQRLAELEQTAAAMFTVTVWKPDPQRDMPRDNSLSERFFLIFPLLQRLATIRAWYRQRGIAEAVLQHTLYDFQLWIEACRERTGLSGFREAGWLRNHFMGQVFRLGRLQFEPGVFNQPFVALINVATGKPCLVAKGGASITAAGRFADSEGACPPFTELQYEEVDGEVRRGHMVSDTGYIESNPTVFASGSWRRVLTDGAAVLYLHIPAGEPLEFAACYDSFCRAAEFFPSYLPEKGRPKAVVCGSWLLYPGLCDILPPESNIVRFQQAFIRFPMRGATADQAYERAFVPHGRATTPLQLKSSLQRLLFEHIAQGGCPLAAGGLILAPFDTIKNSSFKAIA